jgi:hypothetical protein
VLVNAMRDVHAQLDDTYGNPTHDRRARRLGFCVNHQRTERLMAGIGASDGRRKEVRTANPISSATMAQSPIHDPLRGLKHSRTNIGYEAIRSS